MACLLIYLGPVEPRPDRTSETLPRQELASTEQKFCSVSNPFGELFEIITT